MTATGHAGEGSALARVESCLGGFGFGEATVAVHREVGAEGVLPVEERGGDLDRAEFAGLEPPGGLGGGQKGDDRSFLDDHGHDEEARAAGGGIAQGDLAREAGAGDVVGPHVLHGDGVGGGFDAAGVHVAQVEEVAEERVELALEHRHLPFVELEAGEAGDVLHLVETDRHTFLF